MASGMASDRVVTPVPGWQFEEAAIRISSPLFLIRSHSRRRSIMRSAPILIGLVLALMLAGCLDQFHTAAGDNVVNRPSTPTAEESDL